MNIAIIGKGHVGSALARGLDKSGHHIIIGARDTANGDIVRLINEGKHISANTISEASKVAEVIIIAVPINAIISVAHALGDVHAKIIIETTNSFGNEIPGFNFASIAISKITGCNDVVKCFNTIGYESLGNPLFGKIKADTFVAGNSLKAKTVAQHLAVDLGFENCYDLGDDENLQLLENIAEIWMILTKKSKLGRKVAFKILTK